MTSASGLIGVVIVLNGAAASSPEIRASALRVTSSSDRRAPARRPARATPARARSAPDGYCERDRHQRDRPRHEQGGREYAKPRRFVAARSACGRGRANESQATLATPGASGVRDRPPRPLTPSQPPPRPAPIERLENTEPDVSISFRPLLMFCKFAP